MFFVNVRIQKMDGDSTFTLVNVSWHDRCFIWSWSLSENSILCSFNWIEDCWELCLYNIGVNFTHEEMPELSCSSTDLSESSEIEFLTSSSRERSLNNLSRSSFDKLATICFKAKVDAFSCCEQPESKLVAVGDRLTDLFPPEGLLQRFTICESEIEF